MDTEGKNAKKNEEYIRKQLEEDKAEEQLRGIYKNCLRVASNRLFAAARSY